jgi:hypothetical protein
MPQQYRQEDRCDSPYRPQQQQRSQHNMTPFGRSSIGTSSPHPSQYSAYAPNAFGNMLGSFSHPQQQQRQQSRSPWPTTPKQRFASNSRPTTSYRVMDPPSPTNSSFTTASSASESLSSQTSPSLGEGAANQPLSGWTTGKNSHWRTRLIGVLAYLLQPWHGAALLIHNQTTVASTISHNQCTTPFQTSEVSHNLPQTCSPN